MSHLLGKDHGYFRNDLIIRGREATATFASQLQYRALEVPL